MPANWWFDDQGRNNLAGVPGDPDNPPVLPNSIIVNLLINIPIAKRDFLALVPTMLPAEQVRLNGLVAANPATLLPFPSDDQKQSDVFMAKMNPTEVRDPNRKRR